MQSTGTVPGPAPSAGGPVLASGRGCLLWGAVGAAGVLLIFGVFLAWMFGNTTSDPAEARAWAAEMIDLDFPPGIEPMSGVRISGSTLVFAGPPGADPAALSLVVAGNSEGETFRFEDLPRPGGENEDPERAILASEEREFRVRGRPVPVLCNRYEDGLVDYTLLLPGRPLPDGGAWQVMLVLSGRPEEATPEWVQQILDGIR
ncbi:MAG: hypothetical protein D6702_05255 [Planctomycetota bacterium]|nr:MAG: hypothetical protein D6702_05255 [Planctomycetota bacterium]